MNEVPSFFTLEPLGRRGSACEDYYVVSPECTMGRQSIVLSLHMLLVEGHSYVGAIYKSHLIALCCGKHHVCEELCRDLCSSLHGLEVILRQATRKNCLAS